MEQQRVSGKEGKREEEGSLTLLREEPECTCTFHSLSTSDIIAGCHDALFLSSLVALMRRKYDSATDHTVRTVTPDLYSLWSVTSHIKAELLADAINESGVLPFYCSIDVEDSTKRPCFGSDPSPPVT